MKVEQIKIANTFPFHGVDGGTCNVESGACSENSPLLLVGGVA